ncbi:aldo-keto reductase AKR2E4-like [Spodoptera frugiperda]|uniref:Aldo-keto reductase AKR2E4-like n=1 Tax=Spodoptera frugiperda TaxID=7108 RepID=A0A9R0E383_SPOFR|nr:aldo-keto reductase AKR2E4-like [Spodoptera frugiperda]
MLCVLTLLLAAAGSLGDDTDGGVAFRIPLNDGNAMPALGFGTFLGLDENGMRPPGEHEAEYPVRWALEAGYRLLDTAVTYQTEGQVGRAWRASGIPREHVFVVTKLSTSESRNVVASLRGSLARLNMSYVDLYLIHSTISIKPDHSGFDIIDYLDTWRGMEEVKRLGLARSIGISNFNVSQIQRLMAHCEIKPSVLQVEVNLNLAQNKLVDYCKSQDIVVMAFSPFGSLFSRDPPPRPPAPRANDPILVGMANKYNKTTPQIVLRYLVQRGLVPIPKSLNRLRIQQNIQIFDFQLTDEEMHTLSEFNRDYRIFFPTFWQDHPYYPFERVDRPGPSLFKGQGY